MLQRIDSDFCPGGNHGRRWLMDKENKRDPIDLETTSEKAIREVM